MDKELGWKTKFHVPYYLLIFFCFDKPYYLLMLHIHCQVLQFSTLLK